MSQALFGKAFGQFIRRPQERITPKTFFQLLKALPRLRQLDITSCGLRDEDVKDLRVSMPLLSIQRHAAP